MIEATVLFLTVSDHSDNPVVQKWNIDARVNHNFEVSTIGPLREIFSRVLVYDVIHNYLIQGVEKTNSDIINIVQRERPNYLLWASMNYEIKESTFERIRRLGTTVIGWFFDDEVRFNDFSRWWIPYLDYCLTNDAKSLAGYITAGGQARHFMVYSNPTVFKRLKLIKRYDVSFVGTKIADREKAIKYLGRAGVSAKVFGRGWEAGYVPLEQMIEIYNTSRINLCFVKSYGVNSRPQLKCKIFDICMCGGFLLCEYIPGIEEYYEIGKEIICFKDLEEARGKINYYLRHETEREVIAQAGWKRAQRDHGQYLRLLKIFEEIERDRKTGPQHSIGYAGQLARLRPIRRLVSSFHFGWAKALMMEGYSRDRWQKELDMVTFYDPDNLSARCLKVIGHLPISLRLGFIYLGTVFGKLKRIFYSGRRAIPMLRKIKERLIS